jgi:hypothetical protein
MTDDQIRELVKAHSDELLHKLAELTALVTTLAERTDQGFTASEGKIDRLARELSVIRH